MEWDQLIIDFEQKIRAGRGTEVKKVLSEISVQKVPRKAYLKLSNLAVRCGSPGYALKLLGLEIRKKDFSMEALSLPERAEYGGALVSIGAFIEAQKILQYTDGAEYPRAYLYYAFSLFNQWKYSEAVPWLEKFLKANKDPYADQVGRVNLCAALIYRQDYILAESLLQKLRKDLEPSQSYFLLGNVYELLAQCYLGLNDFEKTSRVLMESEKLLERTGSYFRLFVLKWKSVLSLKQSLINAVPEVNEVRKLAVDLQHFETLRECDFFQGTILEERELVQKVFFGSPFASYRDKVLASTPHQEWLAVNHHVVEFSEGGGKIIEGFLPIGKIQSNSVLHNLQKIILSDFYAPLRMATLFSRLFPESHYDPNSSPNRVYQLVHRWNSEAEAESLPLRIKSQKNSFRIESLEPCSVRVARDLRIENKIESQIQMLKDHFEKNEFSAADAQILLARSQSFTSELLQEAQKSLNLQKFGGGRATRYRFSA